MELPFLVFANSIRRHLKHGRKAVLHAFHCDPLNHGKLFFENLDSGVFEVRYRLVQNRFDRFANKDHITAAMYMRLMLPSLLPDVERLLYLDTDTIAVTDISPLYDTHLDGKPLAAMLDYPFLVLDPKYGRRVNLAPDALLVQEYLIDVIRLTHWKTYFNSGVLLMDLEQFRGKNLEMKAEKFLLSTKESLSFPDQDALNHAMDGDFVRLDPRWNLHAFRVTEDFGTPEAWFADVSLWKSDPWIVHYCSRTKPWLPDTPCTPHDKLFWQEAAECAAFPLLVEDYLHRCRQHCETSLLPASELLASGKPGLDKQALARHAQKFAEVSGVSLASLKVLHELERDDKPGASRTTLLPANIFSNRGGVSEGATVAFNLADATGHIIYGPYQRFPRGTYEAVFEFELSNVSANGQSRFVIEVVDETDKFLTQRNISLKETLDAASKSLAFEIKETEAKLEFRIFADGFEGGELRFSGVTLTRRKSETSGRADDLKI